MRGHLPDPVRTVQTATELGFGVAEMRDVMKGAFLREEITDIVESLYDVGRVTAVHEIFGGYTNRSFGIETLKDGRARTYFLRQYRPGVATDDIRFEHALIGHAIRNGFTFAAGIVASARGDTFVRADDSRRMFALFDYLNGEDKYTWDNPDLTHSEFISAGGLLAAFHNAMRNFDPGGLQRSEPPALELWPRLAQQLADYVRPESGGQLQTSDATHLNGILDLITRNPLDSAETEGMPVIAIHCDYHPGNLKWVGHQVAGIFDFDWSKMDLRLFDVALAVIYFCSRWDDGHDGELRGDKCRLFLGAYQHQLQRLQGLEPLSAAEQKLLPTMLDIANIYLIHWEVSRCLETADADDDAYRIFLRHNIRLMRWLETHRDTVVKTFAGAFS